MEAASQALVALAVVALSQVAGLGACQHPEVACLEGACLVDPAVAQPLEEVILEVASLVVARQVVALVASLAPELAFYPVACQDVVVPLEAYQAVQVHALVELGH